MKPAVLDLEIYQGDTFSKTIKLYANAYIDYRGEYKDAYTYVTDDVVLKNGTLYKSLQDANKGYTPPNGTWWGSVTPLDITGGSVEGKIRIKPNSEETVADFTVNITDAANGTFTISLTNTQTAALDFTNAFYDIEVTLGGTVKKYLVGKVRLTKEATY